MKHRFPGEPRRMAFIHRSERRAREAWMRTMAPPLFMVPPLTDEQFEKEYSSYFTRA